MKYLLQKSRENHQRTQAVRVSAVDYKPSNGNSHLRKPVESCKSLDLSKAPQDPMIAVRRYDGELAEREAVAKLEIERRKTQIAPVYNKGPIMYIGTYDAAMIQTIGKK